MINVGDTVIANRDLPNKGVKKGEKGTVIELAAFDSEAYLTIKMEESGICVSASSENCWNEV